MKDADFRFWMDFWALLATHLRIIHELGCKPATLSRKWAWNQSSEGAKGHMKPNVPTRLFSTFFTSAARNHGNQFFGRKAKAINNLIYFCSEFGPYLHVWRLLLMGFWLGLIDWGMSRLG